MTVNAGLANWRGHMVAARRWCGIPIGPQFPHLGRSDGFDEVDGQMAQPVFVYLFPVDKTPSVGVAIVGDDGCI